MKNSEIIYELENTMPIYRNFFREFISGLILLGGSIWASMGLIKFGFLIASLFVLMPVLRDFLGKRVRSLQLTERYLLVRFGVGEHFTKIYLSDIKKVRLLEKGKDRNDWHIENSTQWHYESQDEPTCIIHTLDGRKYEIKGYYFPQGEFANFLQHFHRSFHQLPHLPKFDKKPLKESPDTDRLSKLAFTNMQYLQEDLKLHKALKANMIDAYNSIYSLRHEKDLTLLNDYKILYQYQKEKGETIFFLEGDFLKNLSLENIEIGKNIIEASHQNLHLVESRIDYYKKIAEEVENIRFQEEKRKKLRTVADRLKYLQEQNTNKTILQPNEDDLEIKTILELEELTQQVRRTEDLEGSLYLKEHIELFKDQKA